MDCSPSPKRPYRLRHEVAFVAGGSLLLLGATVVLHQWSGMSYAELMADPAAVTGSPAYLGFLSNVGILLWGAAAGVSLFAAVVVDGGVAPRRRAFLVASGLLTLVAGVDDLFLVHERVLPTTIGVDEKVTYGAYAAAGAAYAMAFRRVILEASVVVLLLALGCFATSVGLDVLVEPERVGALEDGAKAVGLVSWLVFLAGASKQTILRARLPAAPAAGDGAASGDGVEGRPQGSPSEASRTPETPFA